MLDIRLIREKPDFVRERLATRGGGDEAKIDEVLCVDAERRKAETELQRLQSERNRVSKEIGEKNRARKPQTTSKPAFESSAGKSSILTLARIYSTMRSGIYSSRFQICRIRACRLAKIRAQIASSAVGAKNRN